MADNVGKYPVDYTSDVGKVRTLLSDDSPTNITGTPPNQTGEYLFYGDDAIEALLGLKGSPERTAIYIWRMIAITPALQYKKWSSADLSVDGPAITRAIRDIIKDIEAGLDLEDETAVSEYANLVNTGPAMSQPALFPRRVPTYNGTDLDPTLPLVL